jgi:Na+/H+-dicarboxylate symporter
LRYQFFFEFSVMELSATPSKPGMKQNRLTVYIIIAMALGILVGYIVHTQSSPQTIRKFSDNIRLLTKIFLFLVQMIIAPLVFCTLVVGIAKLGDLKAVGRVGGKALCLCIIGKSFTGYADCKFIAPRQRHRFKQC